MTKLRCTICNETDFGVTPPQPEQVLRHMRYVHQLPLTISDPEDRKLWQERQHSMWDDRRTQLREDVHSQEKLETSWSKLKKRELEKELQRHLAIHDDGEPVIQDPADGAQSRISRSLLTSDDVRGAERLMAIKNSSQTVATTVPEDRPLRHSKAELEAADALRALEGGREGEAASTTDKRREQRADLSSGQRATPPGGLKHGAKSVNKDPKDFDPGR